MNTLGLNCGPNSHRYAEKMYAARMKVADKRANDNTREGRKCYVGTSKLIFWKLL